MAGQEQFARRTALGRVGHLGSARSGTVHFWRQRLTAVANIPLTIAVVAIVMGLFGRNHAAVAKILGSPLVAIVMMMFIVSVTYHMWLGMQTIIEDYVQNERLKLVALMGNTFFCVAVGLTAAFSILNLSFGV
jgi:succinate dehydrogenase / fumarate reductase membrane anchor subunit